jgi:hypothetical protein
MTIKQSKDIRAQIKVINSHYLKGFLLMHNASISNNMDSKYSCAWHANLYHLRNFTLVTTYLEKP